MDIEASRDPPKAQKRPRADDEPRCRYLRFSNLPHGCSSDELKALLEPLGKVEEVQVARASGGGMLALVEMSCTREATSAKRRLKDMPLRGSNINVMFDNSRSEQQAASPAATAPGASPQAPQAAKPQSAAMAAPMHPPVGFVGGVHASGFPTGSKLPPFYVPERMERDVHENRVLKMRSVLWTAKEEDIRDFYRPLPLDRDAIEMGRDHAGRFSGMVYVRLRSTADLNQGLRKQSEYLCGRQVILQRLDPGTPNIFRPGSSGFGGGSAPMDPRAPAPSGSPAPTFPIEPRVWPSPAPAPPRAPRQPAPPPTPSTPAGFVSVSLSVAAAEGGRERSLADALAAAPASESLAAIRNFLTSDPRLPPSTRRAVAFLGELRTKLLDDPACSDSTLNRHAFRSPFESAGILGYTLAEVEAVFGTRSADSVFWPIFQTFHTLMPHQAEDPAADDSTLEDFLARE
mmetsp:Transcript_19052/g.48779  ORF Transcript_19052/g.48779 Transcript_19052/m.48779 type:complete len:459 (+) Transcript_19052:124-1500(+)